MQTDCPSIVNDMERLACYDSKTPPTGKASTQVDVPELGTMTDQPSPPAADEGNRQRSLASVLKDHWELDAGSKRGIFTLRPYKPMYVLPFTYTDNINSTPSTSVPGGMSAGQQGVKSVEAKFQVSVKTKVAENLFGDNGDLWLGYTQSSRWQAYNKERSRPFRETVYEPEAMLVFRTDYELSGLNGVMAGIGLNHQSNGRSHSLSRSWNRVIAQAGFEHGDWIAIVRPWWRLPESRHSDDNPEIENYVGRAEIMVARKWQGHVFSLQARHSLRVGDNSRGSAQVAWSFPISGNLKGYVQLFSGYGESLIDYNHRQNVIGLGFSVADWF